VRWLSLASSRVRCFVGHLRCLVLSTKANKLAIQLVGLSEFTISHPLAVPESRWNRFLVVTDWIVVEKRKRVGIVDPDELVLKPRKPGSRVGS